VTRLGAQGIAADGSEAISCVIYLYLIDDGA
jgi:hypothetical protein